MQAATRRSDLAVQAGQRPSDIHARAGLIASEFSLLGLGAALLATAALIVALHGTLALALVHAGLLAAAGLCTAGTLLLAAGWWLNVGQTRDQPADLPTSVAPLFVLATALSAVAWLALWHLHHVPAGTGESLDLKRFQHVTRPLLWAGTLAVPVLAGLALRSLQAVDPRSPMPIAGLFEAIGHTLLGGVALMMLVGLSSDSMSLELKYYLGASLCTGAGHVILWAGWLLRGSRQALRSARLQGIRVPLWHRGHTLASAALVGGVVLPALVVLADLLAVRDVGLAVACALLAVSNHAMRYAWVLLAFPAPPWPRSPSP